MENKITTDTASLIQAVRRGYGFDVISLDFLLRGFGGDCYRVETHKGSSYFIKVHDPIANQMTAASSRDFYLPLTYQLHAKAILPDIPHPMKTLDGELSLEMGSNSLVVTNFIEGALVGFGELSEDVLVDLAEKIGILHRSKEELDFEHPFVDKFEIVFEGDLLRSFGALSSLPDKATVGQRSLSEIVLPRKKQIIADLGILKKIQRYSKSARKPKVVCHTDLHGGNLMTDGQGRLYILDWENALIAPAEHDIFFFAGEKGFWERFWPHYTRQYPSASLDPDLLRFYFYRRALEDAADFILRILRRENDPERDKEELNWLVDCLDGISLIEDTVSRIQERTT